MFRVIAVDDESAALNRFERIAAEEDRLSLIGKFMFADEAVEFVKNQSVDIAFLDIEMPEMSGLELADRLLDIDPYLNVVFVTAYSQYTLEAFRAHAMGYLLKPLDKEELIEQIDVISRRTRPQKGTKAIRQLTVKCFGRFFVCAEPDGEMIRWKTSKAEELFALLIHNKGLVRSKESIIDTLWPELDPAKSANLFRVTCTYIRTALANVGFTDVFTRERDGYLINADAVNCDYFKFSHAVLGLANLELSKLEECSALYSGEYFADRAYGWASGARTRLDADFRLIQFRLAEEYCEFGKTADACAALEKALALDPCDEETVMRLISIKLDADDAISSMKIYNKYKQRLKEELGLFPSEKLQNLIRNIK